MPSKLGFGNSRKKSAAKATYGSALHFKNPLKHKILHAKKVAGHDHSGKGKIDWKEEGGKMYPR